MSLKIKRIDNMLEAIKKSEIEMVKDHYSNLDINKPDRFNRTLLMNAILYGDAKPLTVDLSEFSSVSGRRMIAWEGIAEYVTATEDEESKRGQKWREQFMKHRPCSVCGGSRLKKESLQFRIGGKNIAEVSSMSIADFSEWMSHVEEHLNSREQKIAQEIVKEIRERLHFLVEVGLG